MPRGELVTITVTPTLDTSAFVSGDVLATAIIPFANAVLPASPVDNTARLSGYVEKLVVIDRDLQSKQGELWLFSDTVTPAAANAAHSLSDADIAKFIGVIEFGKPSPDPTAYFATPLNSVATAKGLNLAIVCATTTLYGILVTRGTPTYTAGGLDLKLTIAQSGG